MKKKLLLPSFALIATTMVLIFACLKANDTQSKDAANENLSANSKFKSNEWPTFVISKDRLAQYFVGDNTNKTITVIIRSDLTNPKNSMELNAFGAGNFLTITQDEKYKTELNTKLGIGNNEISLSQISAICRTNGNWVDNFEYLRLTPIESAKYNGYLAFSLSACDKDGKAIQSTNPNRRVHSENESQPSPPADCEPVCNPACPTGTRCQGWPGTCVPIF